MQIPLTTTVGKITHYSETPRLGKFYETLIVYAHGAATVMIHDQGNRKLLHHGHHAAGTTLAAAITAKARQLDALAKKEEADALPV